MLTLVTRVTATLLACVPALAQRLGLLCRYEVGDRVNTRLGPGVEPSRLGKHAVGATDQELELLAQDSLVGNRGKVAFQDSLTPLLQAVVDGDKEVAHRAAEVDWAWRPACAAFTPVAAPEAVEGAAAEVEAVMVRPDVTDTSLRALEAR